MTKQLVIIGNGSAANRVLEELDLHHPFDQITVISDERIPHYNRIMLSPLLANETTLANITPHDATWYNERRIHIIYGDAAQSVDTEKNFVITQTGKTIHYSELVFATGSRSFIPPIPRANQPAVIGFRGMNDVDAMLSQLEHLQHATVIGAGLLGVEAAVGLRQRGVEVTLMHRNSVLMNRQLDNTASQVLTHALNDRGIDVITGANPVAINTRVGVTNAVEYRLANDASNTLNTLETQLVIFATGITPNTELAAASGLRTNRGICVDAQMKTSVNNIYALGECCEFDGITYGLVAPIWNQAKVVASALKEQPHESYCEQTHLTKLKVSGLDVHSIGEYASEDLNDTMVYQDLSLGIYKKLIIKENKIVGVLCVGDITDSNWYYQLMINNTDIQSLRAALLLGQSYCECAE
ncbi:MAG: FAD-dependent oxidoreductase [Oleibacter sp.]|nr:FAD-dependent oxidoreductase [Thalassolituus sp.]